MIDYDDDGNEGLRFFRGCMFAALLVAPFWAAFVLLLVLT